MLASARALHTVIISSGAWCMDFVSAVCVPYVLSMNTVAIAAVQRSFRTQPHCRGPVGSGILQHTVYPRRDTDSPSPVPGTTLYDDHSVVHAAPWVQE